MGEQTMVVEEMGFSKDGPILIGNLHEFQAYESKRETSKVSDKRMEKNLGLL